MKLLVLSDIHANWPALRAVAAAEPDAGGILCLGDIVNYGPHPAECVEWIRARAQVDAVVQGNHDRAVGCGEDPRCSAPYRPLAAAMQRFTEGRLDREARAWLARLPARRTLAVEGIDFELCHAAPSDPLYAYVQADDLERWRRECEQAPRADCLFVGHTHIPFVRKIGKVTVVNPGSVGQPKDGDPRAAYAVWEDGEISLRRAAYDIASVARDLAACAPQSIARRLAGVLLTGGHLAPPSGED